MICDGILVSCQFISAVFCSTIKTIHLYLLLALQHFQGKLEEELNEMTGCGHKRFAVVKGNSLPRNNIVIQYTSLLAFTHTVLQEWGWQCHEQVHYEVFFFLLSWYFLSIVASSHPFYRSPYLELVSFQFKGIQSRGYFYTQTRWTYPTFYSLSELFLKE